MPEHRPQITDTERQQVYDLRAQRFSYVAISERTGIPKRRVESILRERAERRLVTTGCVDCPAVIRQWVRQWVRPHDPMLYRCPECAAKLARELDPPMRAFPAEGT